MKFSRESLVAAVAIAAIAAIAFGHVACATINGTGAASAAPKGSGTANTAPASPARAQEGTGISAYTSFGVNLYKELIREKPGSNVFISPASVGLALAMTMNGAAGGTREAMANALGLSGNSAEAVNADDSTLIARMNDTMRAVKLSVANSLWARRDVTFKKEFLQRNKRYYGAEIRTLDSPKTINDWVAEKTNDKITKIVDEIDPETILYLINAIYFKGTWTKEFDRNLTRDQPFHLIDGATIPRPMMRQSGTYDYFDGDGFQAARLPYGDGRIGMYVFLPADSSSLEQFHEGLTGEKLEALMMRFSPREGRIGLPRFKLEYEATLNQGLAALGMAVAFDGGRADFTRMFEAPGANACIDAVLHKTFIEVNEEGTEAAAVTAVVMKTTSVMEGPRPFEMIVDRPFFLAIVDRETGLILFMGAIVNP
jgi:serpin B